MQHSDVLGVGFWEFALVVGLVLLVLGPEKIGPIARTVGRLMREMQRGATEVRRALKIDDELEGLDEIRRNVVHDAYPGEPEAAPKEIVSSKVTPPGGGPPAPGDTPAPPASWDALHDAGGGPPGDTGEGKRDA